MSFAPLEKPKSLLGWHRQLAPSAGIKVSPLCFGAMNLGTAWKDMLGPVDEKESFELLNYFYEEGGNFIDTASNYQDEESEIILGKWLKARGNRDEMVIATKYTTGWQAYKKRAIIQSNFGGMNAKSLKHSLDASLKKLQTDFVDILYIHWWDYSADIPEVMLALNDIVQQGKALYLGISDTPAWIVAKANEYARGHNLRQFVVYQGRWSASQRDMEREIIPMCRADGMGIAPWGSLGSGAYKTKEEKEKEAGRPRVWPSSENELKVIAKLEEMSKKKGVGMTSVALAYVMHKSPYVFPIVGVRKVSHLKSNIEALGLELTPDEIREIDQAAPFDRGFPMNLFLIGDPTDVSGVLIGKDNLGNSMFSSVDWVKLPQPIQAGVHKGDA